MYVFSTLAAHPDLAERDGDDLWHHAAAWQLLLWLGCDLQHSRAFTSYLDGG